MEEGINLGKLTNEQFLEVFQSMITRGIKRKIFLGANFMRGGSSYPPQIILVTDPTVRLGTDRKLHTHDYPPDAPEG